MCKRAFVLLDLILILSVVSAAAAVIAPVLARSSAERNASICVRNLSQIGRAVGVYVQDYDGRLPTSVACTHCVPIQQALTTGRNTSSRQVNFVDALSPYLDSAVGSVRVVNLWHCPAVNGYGVTGTKTLIGYGDNRITYAMNYALLEKVLSAVRNPEATLMFRETGLMVQANACAVVSGTAKPTRIFLNDPDDWYRTSAQFSARAHGDSTHILFADAHVESFATAELTSGLVAKSDTSGRWGLVAAGDDTNVRIWLTP